MAGIKRAGDEKSKDSSAVKKQKVVSQYKSAAKNGDDQSAGKEKPFHANSSAEAHANQKALAKERKAAKPNADLIERTKKIWEKLRRKSHVPREERKELVAELYAIINGRIHEFVFKHDSVRVVQCALKYANKEQRLNITKELQADIRPLVESKYGKFMVARIVIEGDQEIRDLVIPAFYGHVKRLINHPEAAWIVDDIYRQVASAEQRALMLREWYGPEFALENNPKGGSTQKGDKPTADLSVILANNPEKRAPIMRHLHQLVNGLIQKKLTGFTMLHDAMYQYFTNLPVGSEEANEFLENLKSDLDDPSGGGDLLKNLAFTKNGSKVVCLALAYGSAKDRKQLIRVYKDVMEAMALDAHAYQVLLIALEVTDDTKMSSKAIVSELLCENVTDEADKTQRQVEILTHLTARLPLLYPRAGDAKWLLPAGLKDLLTEVHRIRETTSKKAADTRHQELVSYSAATLISIIAANADYLAKSTTGCQAITEILLEGSSTVGADEVEKALTALAAVATGDPTAEDHVAQNAGAGRTLRTLCQGGKFDVAIKAIKKADRPLGFANHLYDAIKDHLTQWATGPSSFVVVAMTETDGIDAKKKAAIVKMLKQDKKRLQEAADGQNGEKGNAGAKILLGQL